MIPLHVWLPDAHAAAPSHVSALLSGVVLKMGIYGLLRVLSMLPEYPTWLGLALVALGIASGVLGVVFALAQHDLKRLLAYHSIENIGIILIGLGVGVLGIAQGRPGWAVLGFAGGLLHVWNHAAFKSLLFFAAGAVIHATGTREIDALGGLFRRMRFTGAAFLLGAVAICGLPPLNGFVSEWLITLASFRALTGAGGSAGVLGAAAGAPALALIGALAVACFVKAFSAVFLGSPADTPPRPRSRRRVGVHAVVDGGARPGVRGDRPLAGGRGAPRRRCGARRFSSATPERAPTRIRAGSACFRSFSPVFSRSGPSPSVVLHPARDADDHVGLRLRRGRRAHPDLRVVLRRDARRAVPLGHPAGRAPARAWTVCSLPRASASRATRPIRCWTVSSCRASCAAARSSASRVSSRPAASRRYLLYIVVTLVRASRVEFVMVSSILNLARRPRPRAAPARRDQQDEGARRGAQGPAPPPGLFRPREAPPQGVRRQRDDDVGVPRGARRVRRGAVRRVPAAPARRPAARCSRSRET